MELGTIPTEYVVFASAVLTGFIAYQSRLNGLESQRERERYLNSRLQESTVLSDIWAITIDNIQVHERSGLLYRIKKFITGTISGESTVVIRYENRSIPGFIWETEAGRAIIDGWQVEVEHLNTRERSNPVIARFRFESVEDGDISGFFNAIIDLEEEMR